MARWHDLRLSLGSTRNWGWQDKEEEFARSWRCYFTFFLNSSQPDVCKRCRLSRNWTTVASLSIQEFIATEPFHDRHLIRHRRQPELIFRLAQDPHRNPSDDTTVSGFDIDTPVTWIEPLLEAIGSIAAFAPA